MTPPFATMPSWQNPGHPFITLCRVDTVQLRCRLQQAHLYMVHSKTCIQPAVGTIITAVSGAGLQRAAVTPSYSRTHCPLGCGCTGRCTEGWLASLCHRGHRQGQQCLITNSITAICGCLTQLPLQ
jgi:hypothetical protein